MTRRPQRTTRRPGCAAMDRARRSPPAKRRANGAENHAPRIRSATSLAASCAPTARRPQPLAALPRLLEKDLARARERCDRLNELAAGALAEMRALIFELHPESLEQEGLAAALQRQVAALRRGMGW